MHRPGRARVAAICVVCLWVMAAFGQNAAAARSGVRAACPASRWIESWYAAPSDADSTLDPSLKTFTHGVDETFRVIITPHYGGSMIRVRLSNAYGGQPLTVSDVGIAQQADGAALVPGSSAQVLFNGQKSVTIPPGGQVVSDPTSFSFSSFENLAVSMYVPGASLVTEHFTGRQTSYGTLPAAGDDVSDPSATPFSQSTTARYILEGLDVQARGNAGTVVAFGDSITDGFQGGPSLVPETTSTLNLNARYPDWLQRRINAAGLPLSVANAGISGNRILQGGLIPQFGVSAITRFTRDAIDIPGVSTIIILEGANDLGQSSATAPQIISGLTQLVNMAKAAGVHVLLGTLTPMGNASESGYSGAKVNATRLAVNAWIESQTIADGYIDFASAVADPSDPSIINPPDNGGDGLHFTPAGYQALAGAVNLNQLRGPACAGAGAGVAKSQVEISGLKPRNVRAGARVTLRVRVTLGGKALRGAVVRVDRHRARTDAAGRAVLRLRFPRAGHYRVVVSAAGARSSQTTITVSPG